MLRFPMIALVACLAGACAGPRTSRDSTESLAATAPAEPARISLRDYRTGVYLALMSGSDEERIEYYSNMRDDAVTKVQDPEILAAMIQVFDDEGLGSLAQSGPAPAVGGDATKALEVRQGDRIRHLVRRPDMKREDTLVFDEYVMGFQAVYNETYALQAVDSTSTEFRLEPVKSTKD